MAIEKKIEDEEEDENEEEKFARDDEIFGKQRGDEFAWMTG